MRLAVIRQLTDRKDRMMARSTVDFTNARMPSALSGSILGIAARRRWRALYRTTMKPLALDDLKARYLLFVGHHQHSRI
jgi:hypothetical protein